MKCIMKCNKKENWNHLFECEDFIRRVLQNILEVTAKSEKFQKFQQLALEVKVENFLTTKLQKDFKISLTEAQTLMANILIRFILAFKELIWKSKCEQILSEQPDIFVNAVKVKAIIQDRQFWYDVEQLKIVLNPAKNAIIP
ncbi:hypothetical protein GLOIN_2v1790055 [Rhizophagus irregularis DAOM 181602=DAOM 197198]|nr:hypothetical protein GLOIN_2v1790055 [Rhizophagus irregularis DAOM 181602=DAOM 197198]